MTILEAYASGTPVIASRIGSLDEIVAEGETGFTFASGDSCDLAKLITDLRGNLAGLRALRSRKRQRFDERYSPALNYRALMSIYESAVAEFHGACPKSEKRCPLTRHRSADPQIPDEPCLTLLP